MYVNFLSQYLKLVDFYLWKLAGDKVEELTAQKLAQFMKILEACENIFLKSSSKKSRTFWKMAMNRVRALRHFELYRQ